MNLTLLPDLLAVCKLPPDTPLPAWTRNGPFVSITLTPEEISVVCPNADVPSDADAERDWRALKVDGPLGFELTGILVALATPLADAGISIFATSTFNTDYLLVKEDQVAHATRVLEAAGHTVR